MKTTNGVIFNSQQTIRKLLSNDFPVITTFKLKKFIIDYLKILKPIEETRVDLIKKYGKDGKNGKEVDPKGENYTKFAEDFSKLLKEEVKIDNHGIKLSYFKNIQLNVNDLEYLSLIFEDDLEVDKNGKRPKSTR